MGKLHFYSGILIVVLFLLTGQYMHHQYDHLRDMELMQRALFRAGHLYILLFGLIHIALGINLHSVQIPFWRPVQWLASVITFAATGLVVYAFFTELPPTHIERPLTRYSLYMILAGISLHGIVYMFTSGKKLPFALPKDTTH